MSCVRSPIYQKSMEHLMCNCFNIMATLNVSLPTTCDMSNVNTRKMEFFFARNSPNEMVSSHSFSVDLDESSIPNPWGAEFGDHSSITLEKSPLEHRILRLYFKTIVHQTRMCI